MKKSLTFLIAFMLVACFATAQNATLTISAPSDVAGTYDALGAAFGPSACSLGAMGPIGIGDDGMDPTTDLCSPAINDLTGQIALIDRGACNFSLKCYNAQEAGAIAVIVCNNVDDPIVSMPGADSAALVVVPCVMVSRQDCQIFRAAAGLEGSIESITVVDDSNANVIWDGGTFDGGLGDWTINNIACANGAEEDTWTWSPEGTAQDPCGSGQLASPSNCNGAVAFASTFLSFGDNPCAGASAGLGPCSAPQSGELISPVIDLTTSTVAGVSLKWWQNTRQFQSTYTVSFTIDGGENWEDITVNGDLVLNDPAVNETKQVFLPGAVGNEIQVKFLYEANSYFWIIDDVQIVETEANNLQVNSFFAVPPNRIVPCSQVEPIYFVADVSNIGSQEQTNVNLNISIVDDATGEVVYTDDNNFGAVAAAGDVIDIPFANVWTPSSTPATYTGTYTVSADAEDFDANNNVQTWAMEVSPTTFAKDNGADRFLAPAETNWEDGAPKSWGMGNIYHIVNSSVIDPADGAAVAISVDSVTMGISNRNAGLIDQSIFVVLYKWVDDGDAVVQDAERTRVAFSQVLFDGDGLGGDPDSGSPTFLEYTVALTEFTTGDPSTPIVLEDDTDYIIMMEYTDTDPAPDDDIDFEIVAGDQIDYFAQTYMHSLEGVDANGNPTGLGVGTPRHAIALALPMDGSFATGPDFSTTGFGDAIVPVIRMHLNTCPDLVASEELSDDNVFTVFPNPVNSVINVQLELVNPASKMQVAILDTRGQQMMTKEYSNIQKDNLSFDVSNFAAGTYFVTITTNEGVKMKKFIVQR